ncbi:MAG: aspartate aminotransferase family protein, partial [Myxococcales bacterium]|nr:aspartate aminotransferase family protein [Myxococcales bacterium]
MALTREEIIETWQRHLDPAFIKLLGLLGYGRVFVRAEGTRMYDDAGREYLDALAGFGSVNIGHNHPRLIARLQGHLATAAPNFNHLGPTPHAAALARRLAEWLPAPLQVMLWSSTGAEAVEAGLKLARAVTGRAGYVHCEGGFHGTSLGTLGAMGTPRLRAPFEPLLPGGAAVPFGDLDALEAALRAEQRGAFLVEPLQAEGGVHLAPEGYLAAAQALCRTHGALLVLDEVQTGLGRIGARFAFENEGFVPDVLVLAKALSGGLLPIGATITSAALHQKAYGATDR